MFQPTKAFALYVEGRYERRPVRPGAKSHDSYSLLAVLVLLLAAPGRGKLLHRLGFAKLSVRPKHPKTDPAAQAEWGARLADSCARARGGCRAQYRRPRGHQAKAGHEAGEVRLVSREGDCPRKGCQRPSRRSRPGMHGEGRPQWLAECGRRTSASRSRRRQWSA